MKYLVSIVGGLALLITGPTIVGAERVGDLRGRNVEPDPGITGRSTITEVCDFTTYTEANRCVTKVVPNLVSRASFYIAQQATMFVQVTS
jgi:hypothetical protein